MADIKTEFTIPIILAGAFVMVVLWAVRSETMQPYMAIIVLFLIVYIFSFGISIGQSLSSPIKKIIDKASEVAKGNLSSRVYLEAKGELAELADSFNKIAEELELARQQGESTEKSVDMKVRAKTQELEETIAALEQKVRNRTAELQSVIKNMEKPQAKSVAREQEKV